MACEPSTRQERFPSGNVIVDLMCSEHGHIQAINLQDHYYDADKAKRVMYSIWQSHLRKIEAAQLDEEFPVHLL